MKNTEGAFRDWGYGLAQSKYRSSVVTERESWILGNKDKDATISVEANAKSIEPGYDMMTPAQQEKLRAEVDGVITQARAWRLAAAWMLCFVARRTSLLTPFCAALPLCSCTRRTAAASTRRCLRSRTRLPTSRCSRRAVVLLSCLAQCADGAAAQVLTRPEDFDIIATLNLNGDYLSDALAAQVGGIGIAPGVRRRRRQVQHASVTLTNACTPRRSRATSTT